ncbi:MAG: winged helix-turn-helix domain-containing protein [Acidobacteriota bacterium]
MDKSANRFYEFGPFRVDEQARRLLKGAETVAISSKIFDLLLAIIESRGEVVRKDDLMARLWPDTIVEEHNLTQSVSVLRKVLGETPTDHRYIVTVPGTGYRFVAAVREVLEPPTRGQSSEAISDPVVSKPKAERTWLIPSRAFRVALLLLILLISFPWIASKSKRRWPPIKSVAVLPFTPLDNESCEKLFMTAMADALITRLVQTGHIKVSPMSDVLKHSCSDKNLAAIGRELGVDAMLEGKIQQTGARIRITIQLLRTEDGSAVWGEKFDNELTDRFALQDAVSEQIIRALAPELMASGAL